MYAEDKNWEKRRALEAVDKDFNTLPSSEQSRFIDQIKKYDIKAKEFEKLPVPVVDYSAMSDEDLLKIVNRGKTSISEIRQKYPGYSDLSDQQLAERIHKKYYTDMPIELFNQKIGLSGIPSSKEQARLPQQQQQVKARKETDYEKAIKAGAIPIEEINAEIIVIPRKTPLPQQGMAQKYFYTSYHTQNILKTIGYLLITGFCYMLFMETIKRAFYYVAMGTLFPKE